MGGPQACVPMPLASLTPPSPHTCNCYHILSSLRTEVLSDLLFLPLPWSGRHLVASFLIFLTSACFLGAPAGEISQCRSDSALSGLHAPVAPPMLLTTKPRTLPWTFYSSSGWKNQAGPACLSSFSSAVPPRHCPEFQDKGSLGPFECAWVSDFLHSPKLGCLRCPHLGVRTVQGPPPSDTVPAGDSCTPQL